MVFLRLTLAVWAACFSLSASAQDFSAGRWIDLTHAFNERSVYWPTAKTFTKTKVFHGRTEGGWFYAAYNFSAAEHGATHTFGSKRAVRPHSSTFGYLISKLPLGRGASEVVSSLTLIVAVRASAGPLVRRGCRGVLGQLCGAVGRQMAPSVSDQYARIYPVLKDNLSW